MKTNNIIFTSAMVIVIAVIVLLSACGVNAERYTMNVHVVDCDTRTDIVVVEDDSGNLWEWEGVENWQAGDCAVCVMDNSGTASIYDDAIISLRQS